MTEVITPSASTAGNPPWIHLSGSLQEVLDELQNQNVKAGQVVWFTYSDSTAQAVFCRMQ